MSEIDKPVDRALPWSPAAASLSEALEYSDIDGFGNEGSGYDYEYMAQQLIQAGWVWTGEEGEPAAPYKPEVECAPPPKVFDPRAKADLQLVVLRHGGVVHPLDVTLTSAFLDTRGTLHVHPVQARP